MVEPPSEPLTIEELIERSSLGTPEAKAVRESVDPDLARRVVERANALSRQWDSGAERCPVSGAPCWECDHECLSCGVPVPQGGSACDACRPMMEADAAGSPTYEPTTDTS